MLLWLALMPGCNPIIDRSEVWSFIDFVAFSADGRSARVAGISGGDNIESGLSATEGFEVTFDREEGASVERQHYSVTTAPPRLDVHEFLYSRQPVFPGFEVSLENLSGYPIRVDARSPAADFFVRVSNIDPEEQGFSADVQVTFLTNEGQVIDEVRLY